MNSKPAGEYLSEYTTFPAKGVNSLNWSNDKLVDWVSGDVTYQMDGTKTGPSISYPYRFDAAVASPSGVFTALYERLGTKALVLGPDHFVREINRSYYHAHVYEYPILFFRLPGGREVLAHCPNEYCDLQIEDPSTGSVLSVGGTGSDFFHSRLGVSPNGNRLLSAGWIWHPFDDVKVFDIRVEQDAALRLETVEPNWSHGVEISSAAFNLDGKLIVTASPGGEDFFADEPGERLRPGMVGVYDFEKKELVSFQKVEGEVGTLMPLGNSYVVGLHDCPRLIDLSTGGVLREWPEVRTGQQLGSILWHKLLPPPIACDPKGGRLAVADDEKITVMTFSPSLLAADL